MIKKKFAVIGLGKFGMKLFEELSDMGLEVIAIDSDSAKVGKVKNIASESLIMDASNKEALEKSGVKDVDCVIVSMGRDMEASILITAILKEIGAKEIIVRAESPRHAQILKNVGAHRIVLAEEDTAVRLAHAIHFSGVQEYIDIDGPWDLAEIRVSKNSKLIDKKISDIHNCFEEGIDILMIEKVNKIIDSKTGQEREERENMSPKNGYTIQENDILIIFGQPKNVERFIEKLS